MADGEVAVLLDPVEQRNMHHRADTGAGDALAGQIQLRRGTTTMTITWPVSAAVDFAVWMRELLR